MLKLPFSIPLFKQNKDSHKFLTIDIGADAVKCVAFYIEDASTKIIGAGKHILEQGAVREGSIINLEQVEGALKMALNQTLEDSEEDINKAIFGLSGATSLSIMTTARVSRGKNTQIDQNEMDEMYKKVTESSYTEINNELLEITGSTDTDMELITSSPVYIKVDDKNVKNPIGMQAQVIELAVSTTFSPNYNTKTIQKLAKNTGLSVAAIGSNMYGLVKSLKYSKGSYFDGVLIDIGSDTTDVAIIFGGGIVCTRYLSIGGNHFTELISQKMGLTYRDAEKIKKSYAQGLLTKSESLIVQSCMTEVLSYWLHGLELLFGEFTGVKTFSPKIFLTGGGALLPDVQEVISKEPWARSVAFKAPPEFIKLEMSDLPRVADATQKISSQEFLVPSALSSIYLELKGLLDD